ncbi:hypothetical protein CBW16_11715 [Flavobacteriaceae bacterium JJC]|nr:hypothetical protein CBW16_11715 [Flavobacteriaceae bacterium JJC]
MIKKLFLVSALGLGAFYYGQTTTIFQENFEPATAALWQNVDRDGDGEKWEFYNAESDGMPAFTGGFATSWSWFLEAFTPDNTLTSPPITLPVTSDLLYLKFKVGAFDETVFEEHYAVYIIPATEVFSGSEFPVFEETLDAGYTETAKNVTVDISTFAGQDVRVVLRHYNCTDVAFIGFDDVEIYQIPRLGVGNSIKNKVKIYPNPTSDFIKIQNAEKVDLVRIFDLSGKLVKETKSSEIDVRPLSAGSYILNIHSGNEITSQKFVKK